MSSPLHLFEHATIDPSVIWGPTIAVESFNQTALLSLNTNVEQFCSSAGAHLKMLPFSYDKGPVLTAMAHLIDHLSTIYNTSVALNTDLFKMKVNVFETKAKALCFQLNELAHIYRDYLKRNDYNRLYQLIDLSHIVNFFSKTFTYSLMTKKNDFALKMIADIHLIHSAPAKASNIASLISLKGKGEIIYDEAAQQMIDQCDYESGFKTVAKANAIRFANSPVKGVFAESNNPENDHYLFRAFEETLAQNNITLAHYARELISSKIAQVECLAKLIHHAVENKDFPRVIQYAQYVIKVLPKLRKEPFLNDMYSKKTREQTGLSLVSTRFTNSVEQMREYLLENNQEEMAHKLKKVYL